MLKRVSSRKGITMADDAIAYDAKVTSEEERPHFDENNNKSYARWFCVRMEDEEDGASVSVYIDVPASDLPSARVGDKVQVALFLRPEVADGE